MFRRQLNVEFGSLCLVPCSGLEVDGRQITLDYLKLLSQITLSHLRVRWKTCSRPSPQLGVLQREANEEYPPFV